MNFNDAKRNLLVHAGLINDPAMSTGWLGLLRPYRFLPVKQFHDIMNCLLVMHPELSVGCIVDKDIVRGVFHITHTTRLWATGEFSVIRRNKLISADNLATLEVWLQLIERIVVQSLDGSSMVRAFFPYFDYLSKTQNLDELKYAKLFVFPVLTEAIQDADHDIQEAANLALERLNKS